MGQLVEKLEKIRPILNEDSNVQDVLGRIFWEFARSCSIVKASNTSPVKLQLNVVIAPLKTNFSMLFPLPPVLHLITVCTFLFFALLRLCSSHLPLLLQQVRVLASFVFSLISEFPFVFVCFRYFRSSHFLGWRVCALVPVTLAFDLPTRYLG